MDWLIAYDPSRNTDTNSGGGANGLNIGDVQDSHDYPSPGSPTPNFHQYAEQGEYGGLGYIMKGHEWVDGGCGAYLKVDSPESYIGNWSTYVAKLTDVKQSPGTSIAIYTQLSDVETECDGWLNCASPRPLTSVWGLPFKVMFPHRTLRTRRPAAAAPAAVPAADDRTSKFSDAQIAQIKALNEALIAS